MNDIVLKLDNLAVAYGRRRVLQDVSFELAAGECLGVVGESGSGKSTLVRALIGLVPAQKGELLVAGQNFSAPRFPRPGQLAQSWQMVFQDPTSSLDPRWRTEDLVLEALEAKGRLHRSERQDRALSLLAEVGLDSNFLHCRPHQLSGGQKQRLAIARALASRPAILLLDEAVSALDVSVQAQILQLLAEISATRGTAYLFVSHDLAALRHLAQRIAVLEKGRIIELQSTEDLICSPEQSYSAKLLAAARHVDF